MRNGDDFDRAVLLAVVFIGGLVLLACLGVGAFAFLWFRSAGH